jgi:quercetin dioxygenase-like cupin family protein
MKAGWLVGVVVALAGTTAAWAQDPLEVGPDIYKKVFENERVRVMEVTFAPGATIGPHSHPDHFAYVMEPGTLRIKNASGMANESQAKAGDVMWINAETHSAENVGTTTLKLLVVELKPQQPATPPATVQ